MKIFQINAAAKPKRQNQQALAGIQICALCFLLSGCQLLGKKSSQAALSAEKPPARGLASALSSVSRADKKAFDKAAAAVRTGDMRKLTDSLPPYPEGSVNMLKFLNLRGEHGSSLLHMAIFEKNLPMAREIVEKAAGESMVLNAINDFGDSPIHFAVRTDSLPIVNFLLEQEGLNVNARNSEGETPLRLSCMRSGEPFPIIAALAAKGANPAAGSGANISAAAFCDYYQGGNSKAAKLLRQLLEDRQK